MLNAQFVSISPNQLYRASVQRKRLIAHTKQNHKKSLLL